MSFHTDDNENKNLCWMSRGARKITQSSPSMHPLPHIQTYTRFQGNLTVTHSELATRLQEAVDHARFNVDTIESTNMELNSYRQLRWSNSVVKTIELSARELKHFYSTPNCNENYLRVYLTFVSEGQNGNCSRAALLNQISTYDIVSEQGIGHALGGIIPGSSYHAIREGPSVAATVSTLDDMVDYLILRAALSDSFAAATLFIEYAEGKALTYETRALVSGIALSSQIVLEDGVCITNLPFRTSELPDHLPKNTSITESDYLGRAMLMIRSTIQPAFWNPNEKPKISAAWSLAGHTIEQLCDSISVFCNTEVRPMTIWEDYGTLQAFQSRSPVTISHGHIRHRPRQDDANVSEKELRGAFTFMKNCNDLSALRIGVSQWVKSKRYMLDNVERLIHLRTALEAVLLEQDNRSEMRFRLALHGACFLATSQADKRMYFDRLKSLYDLTSKAVHTGKIENTAGNRELLDFGSNACRDIILKRTNCPDNEFDWQDILFGT